MGLLEAWRRKDFGYLFVSQADIDAGRLADQRLEQINRSAFDAGKITPEEYDRRNQVNAATSFDAIVTDPKDGIAASFKEGWKEGAGNVQRTIKSSIAAPINFTLGSIPWQLWLIVAAFVGWKLGLFNRLVKK